MAHARRIAPAFLRRAGRRTTPAQPLITTHQDNPLPKPNYSFEKRQREITKKKKQDDKQAKKVASRDSAKAQPNPNAPTTEGS